MKMVTYEAQGKRTIMTVSKRRELAQKAADKLAAELLFDEEVDADIATDDVPFTIFAIASSIAAITVTALIAVQTFGGL